jgi:hypothetical protein
MDELDLGQMHGWVLDVLADERPIGESRHGSSTGAKGPVRTRTVPGCGRCPMTTFRR